MRKFMKNKNCLFCLFLILSIVVGCSAWIGKAKPISEMTPKERATWMFGTYNSQFNDYQHTMGYQKGDDGVWVKVSTPKFTSEQVRILKERKAALTKVYPLIKVYDGYVNSGTIPDRNMEDEIMIILNSLMAM